MKSLKHVCSVTLLCGVFVLPVFGSGITSLAAPGTAIDTVGWSQLGGDLAPVSQDFSATSTNSVAVTGSFGSAGGGLTSIIGTSWGPASTGYSNGDTVLWAENPDYAGSGPVSLSFAAQGGVGAYLQSVSSGQFSASLAVYDGASLLATYTFTSDASGDALFLGALSDSQNITQAVFSGLTCGSYACDPADFSINTLQIYASSGATTPEPSTFLLAGTFCAFGLILVGLKRENSKAVLLRSVTLVAFAAWAYLATEQVAYAQDEPVIAPGQLSIKTPNTAALTSLRSPSTGNASKISLSLTPALPIWQYSVLSPRDSNVYTGSIVGGNPFNRGGRTTTVKVVIIPLRIALTGTPRTFDPTSLDTGCLGAHTASTLTQQSPIFNTVPNLTMNGVNLGTVTFPDAFQRASFWSSITAIAPAYHLAFSTTVAPVQTITTANNSAGSGASYSFAGDCGTNAVTSDNPQRFAFMDINFVDAQLNTIIANLGLTADQFPLFLTYRTYLTDGAPGSLSGNCCILGYHSTVSNSPTTALPGQTYGIASYDPGVLFSGVKDVTTISHEVMEWVNDPSTVNLTPEWGNIGQVSGCVVSVSGYSPGQNNLEVGDPLSGKQNPAVVMTNGVTYHTQELAFYSWFIGGASLGTGAKYSSNGTFTGYAKNCSTGGGTF